MRKGVVVGTFEELLVRGKDKLGVPASEPVRVVLECDGTQIEDGEYFRTLANNTVLLLLRQGERWYPTGVDVIKAGGCNKFTPISGSVLATGNVCRRAKNLDLIIDLDLVRGNIHLDSILNSNKLSLRNL